MEVVMPRDGLFTAEEIIDAAFHIFAQEGLQSISARRVAAHLKCSTAPVYTVFSSMEELKAKVVDKALNILLDYTAREYTPQIFLNIGVGMLEFAKDYGFVYRALFLESDAHEQIFNKYTPRNLQLMKHDQNLGVFNEDELKTILQKLTVHTHGLAALICAKMLPTATREYFIETLRDVGGDIICATALKLGKLEEYLKCEGEDNHEDHNY